MEKLSNYQRKNNRCNDYRLRQKIESNPKNPKYLQTIRGSGYVLWIE